MLRVDRQLHSGPFSSCPTEFSRPSSPGPAAASCEALAARYSDPISEPRLDPLIKQKRDQLRSPPRRGSSCFGLCPAGGGRVL